MPASKLFNIIFTLAERIQRVFVCPAERLQHVKLIPQLSYLGGRTASSEIDFDISSCLLLLSLSLCASENPNVLRDSEAIIKCLHSVDGTAIYIVRSCHV